MFGLYIVISGMSFILFIGFDVLDKRLREIRDELHEMRGDQDD